TITSTPTKTATATLTSKYTPTRTATATQTKTVTASETVTNTATPSATVTAFATFTPRTISTPTHTPTVTPTNTPSPFCEDGAELRDGVCSPINERLRVPQNVIASDGTSFSSVSITCDTRGKAFYKFYRSEIPGEIGEVIAITKTTSHLDKSAIPGVHYWYSVAALNSKGEGRLSLQDEGWRKQSGAIDSDGDMVSDEVEALDGTDLRSRGDSLLKEAFTQLNNSSKQLVIESNEILPTLDLSLVSSSTAHAAAQSKTMSLDAGVPMNVDLSYLGSSLKGLLRLRFVDKPGFLKVAAKLRSEANDSLGRLVSSQTALVNASRGDSYAILVSPAANQELNVSSIPKRFTTRSIARFDVEIFGADGRIKFQKMLTIRGLATKRLRLSRSYGALSLLRIRPADGASKYIASLGQTLDDKVILEMTKAGSSTLNSLSTSSCPQKLLLGNVREKPIVATISLIDSEYNIVDSYEQSIAPKQAQQIDITKIFNGAIGKLFVSSSEANSLIGHLIEGCGEKGDSLSY
ncbi:MAG: hypothetical protein GYA55_09945, partial [SAR324 cluster bacterium]|nr:hypothetical protein [SAR324 cluster bacterium]